MPGRPAPMRVGPAAAGLICVEALHPAAHRAALALDPDLVLLATNDAWTGSGPGTRGHDATGCLAATTLDRPVARGGNTGPSWVRLGAAPALLALPAVEDTAAGRVAVAVAVAVAELPLARAPWSDGRLAPRTALAACLAAAGVLGRRGHPVPSPRESVSRTGCRRG